MAKIITITLKNTIRVPDSARIVREHDGDELSEHVDFNGTQLRPDLCWLQFHKDAPPGFPGELESLWMSVNEDATAYGIQPVEESWQIVEEGD